MVIPGATAEKKRTSIVLFESSSDQAMVQMRDGDKFYVAVADAARACQVFERVTEFANQFNELVTVTLPDWIKANQDKIKSAHLTIRARDILFVVVQSHVEFDKELADSLSDLDIAVANSQDYTLIDLEVLAIPPVSDGSCTAFLASGHVHKL